MHNVNSSPPPRKRVSTNYLILDFLCHKDAHYHSFGIYFITFAICFGCNFISSGLLSSTSIALLNISDPS